MRTTGIVRRLDDLGRVVLPIELRRALDWQERDRIEIFTEEHQIILKKFEPNCCFCGGRKELKEFRGRLVCAKCIAKMSEL